MIEVIEIPKEWHKDKHDRFVLSNLILNYHLRNVAEVGVFKGRTMRAIMRSFVAKEIDQWFAIDPWQSNETLYRGLGNQDKWERYYRGVCVYMPWFRQLKVMRMHSLEAVGLFPDGYLDLVYIDGDHSAGAVAADIRAWAPKVRAGGLIAGHDFVEGDGVTDTYNVAAGVRSVLGDDFTLAKCSIWYKVLGDD